MIDENKFIEYVRNNRISIIEDNYKVSIDGVIDRFKEEVAEDEH